MTLKESKAKPTIPSALVVRNGRLDMCVISTKVWFHTSRWGSWIIIVRKIRKSGPKTQSNLFSKNEELTRSLKLDIRENCPWTKIPSAKFRYWKDWRDARPVDKLTILYCHICCELLKVTRRKHSSLKSQISENAATFKPSWRNLFRLLRKIQ